MSLETKEDKLIELYTFIDSLKCSPKYLFTVLLLTEQLKSGINSENVCYDTLQSAMIPFSLL